jgi:hypothetical protein
MLTVESLEQSSPMTISIGKPVTCLSTLSRALGNHFSELNAVIATLTKGVELVAMFGAGPDM